MLGGYRHAQNANLHWKTFKNIKNTLSREGGGGVSQLWGPYHP